VARATPDGYTIGIGQWGSHVANGAIYKLPYDLLNDFAPIAWIANGTPLIVSKNSIPAANLMELIAWLKANPGNGLQGTAGVGSPQHIAGVYFQSETGTRFQFIPYRGVAPAMQDLIAGNIDFMIDQATNSLPQVRAGKIRAYAVTAKSRLTAATEIPTVDEAGLPGFPYLDLAGALGAQGHAARNSREDQFRGRFRAQQSCDDPAVRRHCARNTTSRSADTRGARSPAKGGDRQVVAHDQSSRDQA
jgi:tripartite-type tricarboxylate transporter receptor subunit TctC